MSTSGSKSNEHVAHFLVDIHNQSRNEASGTLQEAEDKRQISQFDLHDLGHS